jgi:hypothetical protein
MARSDRKRREKRVAAQVTQIAYQKWTDLHRPGPYPDIVFETSQGNGYFVAEVQAIAKQLDFDSPEMGPDWIRQFYRRFRSEGHRAARAWLADLEEETRQEIVRSGVMPAHPDDYPHIDAVPTHLGDCIFAKIPIETRKWFLPMNDFSVEPVQGSLLIRFTSLLEEPGEWGTAYYSRLMPKVEVDGKRVTVAFSKHAIEQLCARRTPRYLNYGANGDAHSYLAKCVFHEVVTLENGSQVFRLWDFCDIDGYMVYATYVLSVFGEENRKPFGGRCHYILGYCPFVLENGFAKAKSFLYPGFRGTPERAILESGGEQGAQYAKWLDESENEQAEPFFETERAVEVTKWLHENGAPQVVQMKHTVMRMQ